MANVPLTLDAKSNLPEVLSADEAALRRQQAAHEKGQKEIAKIIAKGDPLKALEIQKERELKALERAAARSKDLTEEAEKAKLAVIERYAARRQAIIEADAKSIADAAMKAAQEADKAAAKVAAASDAAAFKVTSLGGPLKNVSGLVGKLGGEAGGALGNVGKLGVSMLSTFAVGGPIALGIAAVGAGVGAIVSHFRDAKKAAEEAEAAQVAAWSEATSELKKYNQALLEKLRLEGRSAAGTTPTAGEIGRDQAAHLVATKERELAALQAQIDAAADEAEAWWLRKGGANTDRATIAAARANAAAELRAQAETVRGQLAEAKDILKEAQEAAERERMDRPGTDERDPTFGIGRPSGEAKGAPAAATRSPTRANPKASAADAKAAEREAAQAAARAQRLALDARTAVEDALAGDDLVARINLQMKRAIDAIDARLIEARELAKSSDAQTAADATAALADLEQQKTNIVAAAEASRAALRAEAARRNAEAEANSAAAAAAAELAEKQKDEAMAIAGMQAAAAFGHGFKAYFESNDPMDLFKGILGAAAGLFTMFEMAPVGAGLGILGGFFRDGGVSYGYRVPEGRRGLVTTGRNNDGLPAILHPREVVMPADVVEQEFGGIPEAARIAAGKGSRGRGGGNVTIVQMQAFDSVDGVRALSRQEGARVQRINARQGGLERAASMAWMQQPRHA